MSGKGDRYRPVDQKAYGDSYDRIFGVKHRVKSYGTWPHVRCSCGWSLVTLWPPEMARQAIENHLKEVEHGNEGQRRASEVSDRSS
jgi:hypothetical protein